MRILLRDWDPALEGVLSAAQIPWLASNPAVKRAEEVWGAHADIGLALALAVALPLLRALLDWLVFKVTARLSQRLAARAPLGSVWAGARPAVCARHHSLAVPVLPLRAVLLLLMGRHP